MNGKRVPRTAVLALALAVALGLMAAPALGHAEREVRFPAGTGKVPTYRKAPSRAEPSPRRTHRPGRSERPGR